MRAPSGGIQRFHNVPDLSIAETKSWCQMTSGYPGCRQPAQKQDVVPDQRYKKHDWGKENTK